MLDPKTRIDTSQYFESGPTEKEQLIKELLEPSNVLLWDMLDLVQSVPEVNRQRIYDHLFIQPQLIERTSFRFKREGIEGKITECKEELRLSEVDHATALNSLSINRKLAPKQSSFNGKLTYLPFQPGGVFAANQNINREQQQQHSAMQFLHKDESGLYDIPPGFSRGLKLDEDGNVDPNFVHLGEAEPEDEEDVVPEEYTPNLNEETELSDRKTGFDDLDDAVPLDYSLIKDLLKPDNTGKHVWAHVVDLSHKIENFDEVVPKMARTWPFELDTFQKEAVYHLEQGDSVFVAAHTSAGKTVVAEYAIAMAARNMTKTIYTSPIKALSNQKFRDFKETFKDMEIGLITGDVQINPDANCLIMTTEILRSMLYRGADLIRDVEFVIFDEVHYVNDIERGVVWEEVIIMLPDHVKYVLLSATVPNTYEFANWVGRTKQKDMYVISTPKRPVPLEIFVWAKNNLYKALDSQGVFSESEFRAHKDALEPPDKAPPSVSMGAGSRKGPGGTARGGNRGRGAAPGRGRGAPPGRGGRGGAIAAAGGKAQFARDGPNKNTWSSLVQYLNQKELLPAVIFVFSKKRCEQYADNLGGVNFCNSRERSEIHMFIDRAIARLKKEDRELPQILKIREMLSRGIAVHHGGLLPIVKECIEILFAKSLVKVLFATETFAMGLNLPTRTVVFCELRKHDGRGFRNLLPGEFTQMAGRAGRRGLDTTGTVIVMAYNKPLSPTDFKEVTMGKPTKLLSQFRLTYNMILNLLRIEALRVEEMIKHSFSENSTQTLLPQHKTEVESLTKMLGGVQVDEVPDLAEFEKTFSQLSEYQDHYTKIVMFIADSPNRLFCLKLGRLMVFVDDNNMLRLGFLYKSHRETQKAVFLTFDHGEEFESRYKKAPIPYFPCANYLQSQFGKIKYDGNLRLMVVPLERIQFMSKYSTQANLLGVLKNESEAVAETVKSIQTITRFWSRLEEVALLSRMLIHLHELIEKREAVVLELLNQPVLFRPEFNTVFSQLQKRDTIRRDIDLLNKLISDENLELIPDYEQRLKVLEELGFIDKNQNVVLKGRVACEINSGWELVLTELILDNFLGDFEPEEIVALLSCFVYEGRNNEEESVPITPRLERGRKKILEISEKLLKVYTRYQVSLTSEEEEFLERNRFALVNSVYEWARGLTFKEIMEISVELEGTIVRVITRLDEICRQVKNAALIVGDSALHSKMSEAQERIKRDIVFCASLYL